MLFKYCAENLINDLGKEWSEYSRQRSETSSDGPKSLWEELADIGEEFVEFLEKVSCLFEI